MAYPAQHDYYSSYEDDQSRWEIVAEDRNGPQRARRRRRRLSRALFLITVLGGTGWLHYKDPTILPQLWLQTTKIAWPMIERALERAQSPSETQPKAPTDIAAGNDTEPASGEPVTYGSAPEAKAFLPAAASAVPGVTKLGQDEAPPSPANETPAEKEPVSPPVVIASLPPVKTVKPSEAAKSASAIDAYRARAEKAGLHPGLSRVLLSQLSKADLKNAKFAIGNALAKTADDATYTWPKRLKKKDKLAIFKVHFVPGAAEGCRRYVVTIAKNRWLTTALPMEKCGVRRAKLRAKTSRVSIPQSAQQ